MKNSKIYIYLVAVCTLMAGCASNSTPPVKAYEMNVRYAEVTDIRRVELPSNAPAGAVVGGFTGLVLSRKSSGRKQVASGIGGAVLGGLATKALEGERLGYNYRVRFEDGSTTNFITEKGYLQNGDCVSVERGQHANIRRVSTLLCNDGRLQNIDQKHMREARQCHDAKDQLLTATTKDEIEAASQKVSVICKY